MRPLFHPSIDEITVEGLLHALSDPVRASIFLEIASAECTPSCASFSIVQQKSIPKSTLSLHFKILREAGLIRGERHGVEMRNSSRAQEIEKRFPGLLFAILSAYKVQYNVEEKPAKRTVTKK